MKSIFKLLCFVITCVSGHLAFAQNWPQATGPAGDWSTHADTKAPASFNVATGENILWTKPLDESGQSGIVVWGDRLFLTILKPCESPSEDKETIKTSAIRALCLNALNGETIWEYEIECAGESGYM